MRPRLSHAVRRPAGSRRRSQYPQVEPGAFALAHRAVALCPPDLPIGQALARLHRGRARLLVVREKGWIGVARPGDLRQAAAWGLAQRAVRDVAWRDVPMLAANAPEVRVRRLLLSGAAAVLIQERGVVIGAVETSRLGQGRPPVMVAGRLERDLPEATRDLLRLVSRLSESQNVKAFVAGGFVRDLLRGAPSSDLDIVVEGDAVALARHLCRQLGGSLVVHRTFGTASIEGWGGGRVDVATARREYYPAPGALPAVAPARIEEDLARRDFTVNAIALALTGPAFGQLLDPRGGQQDLARRRLRILRPLSFVEDPTRIFRAARYATRLKLSMDRWTRHCLANALALGAYPALSGQRLLAELELILAEPEWEPTLIALGRVGALRLLDPAYRFSPLARARIRDLGALFRWRRERGVALDPLPLALLCLVGHLPGAVAARCLGRLALSGEPLARLVEARAQGPIAARKLEEHAGAPASQRAALLRALPPEGLGFAWLVGSAVARGQIAWYLAEGERVRPLLRGADLLTLGVAKGPAVSRLLHWLRDQRLDGLISSREDEVRTVREWMTARAGAPEEG